MENSQTKTANRAAPATIARETTAQAIQEQSAAAGNGAISPVRIAVRSIDFYYGKFQALKQITMDIYDRQVTAFIGPSGCGKSTFLRCFNRMNDLIADTRVEGSITLDGENIYARGVDVVTLRKRVGMVFQRPNPFPMSIHDNITYGPKLHGNRNKASLDEIVERTLQQAALWDEVKDTLNKSAMDLSGGQQQRLCIARVLAVEPEVILMDEPASALDPNSTHHIEELIAELQPKYTIVIVTHNMQQAVRVSSKTAFFFKGVVVEYGDTRQIFEQPKEKQTEDYVMGRFG